MEADATISAGKKRSYLYLTMIAVS
jgi:hypothetical protein